MHTVRRHVLLAQKFSVAAARRFFKRGGGKKVLFVFDSSIYLPIIIIIWSKMAQLGLEESSEVDGFRRLK